MRSRLHALGLFVVAVLFLPLATALGLPNVLTFGPSDDALTLAANTTVLPIIYDSVDDEAVHIAIDTFADDVLRVTGTRPELYADGLPEADPRRAAIIVGTVNSKLIKRIYKHGPSAPDAKQLPFTTTHNHLQALRGKWESYHTQVMPSPLDGLDEALVLTGSDRRGTIYALYTLSEQLGVSPWYWWADVPITTRSYIGFPRSAVLGHGEPTVKYRGLFLNDEQPVLHNWAKNQFGTGDAPPFQVGMYEKVFELVLRLKGNYMWPAMWDSMFAVDPLTALPAPPAPGPNQALAQRMGIVMGTSHHEPMGRNQKEFTTFGQGVWDYRRNGAWLRRFWKYGAERARGCETLFTVGMRGDGDLPLDGADKELIEQIVTDQKRILHDTHGPVPKLWAMYKEVMSYFATGLRVPHDVTPLLSDDNWGNLMAVLPRPHPAGGGVYYHADYVGDPRSYKWINTVSLAKMWEQLDVALAFGMDEVWVLNVGDLKTLEVPAEYFLDLAYDAPRWRGLRSYLAERGERDFGVVGEDAAEVADIMGTYSIYASRRKAELVDAQTYSLIHFDEAETVAANWTALLARAEVIYAKLDTPHRVPFYEILLVQLQLQANLAQLYLAVAKSNLYASQGRTAASAQAYEALRLFERDQDLTNEFDTLLGGKWKHMLAQTHIGYEYWQMPVRNALPPVSFISTRTPSWDHGAAVHTRVTVENSAGAWPGDNQHNCRLGYACADPALLPMDRFGRERWVEISSGGPEDVNFTASSDKRWLVVEPRQGRITGDGKNDVRLGISVDWEAASDTEGHVVITASDGMRVAITVPIKHVSPPPAGFKGAVEGDGYIAIEAGRYQQAHTVDGVSWAEIPYYGRTHSGLGLHPVSANTFAAGQGPSVGYTFWATSRGDADVEFHLGPSLNYILGRRNAFAVQLDDGPVAVIHPVPESKAGTAPDDWEEVVASENRVVSVSMRVEAGEHVLKVFGMGAGVVLTRVVVDFGGGAARASHLGPPGSVVL